MHNQSKNIKAKKKKNCFFLMTSAWYCSSSPPTKHGLVLEKEKKNFAQHLVHFSTKTLRFPSSNINSSIQTQKMHKKSIIARTKQTLIFEISSNELQKSQKLMGFALKQYSLQVSNLNRAWKPRINNKRKKNPKKSLPKPENEK